MQGINDSQSPSEGWTSGAPCPKTIRFSTFDEWVLRLRGWGIPEAVIVTQAREEFLPFATTERWLDAMILNVARIAKVDDAVRALAGFQRDCLREQLCTQGSSLSPAVVTLSSALASPSSATTTVTSAFDPKPSPSVAIRDGAIKGTEIGVTAAVAGSVARDLMRWRRPRLWGAARAALRASIPSGAVGALAGGIINDGGVNTLANSLTGKKPTLDDIAGDFDALQACADDWMEDFEENIGSFFASLFAGAQAVVLGIPTDKIPKIPSIGSIFRFDTKGNEQTTEEPNDGDDDTLDPAPDPAKENSEIVRTNYRVMADILIGQVDHTRWTPEQWKMDRAKLQYIYTTPEFRNLTIASVRGLYGNMISIPDTIPDPIRPIIKNQWNGIPDISPSIVQLALKILGEPEGSSWDQYGRSIRLLHKMYDGNIQREAEYCKRKRQTIPTHKKFEDLTIEELLISVVSEMHLSESLMTGIANIDPVNFVTGGITQVFDALYTNIFDPESPSREHAEKLGITENLITFMSENTQPITADYIIQLANNQGLTESDRDTLTRDIIPFARHAEHLLTTSSKYTVNWQGLFQTALSEHHLSLREVLYLYTITDGLSLDGTSNDEQRMNSLSPNRKMLWYFGIAPILQTRSATNSGKYVADMLTSVLPKAALSVLWDKLPIFMQGGTALDSIDPDVLDQGFDMMAGFGDAAWNAAEKTAETGGDAIGAFFGINLSDYGLSGTVGGVILGILWFLFRRSPVELDSFQKRRLRAMLREHSNRPPANDNQGNRAANDDGTRRGSRRRVN